MNDSSCIKQSFFDRLCRLDGSGEWKANNICFGNCSSVDLGSDRSRFQLQ
jgi:hypothetical protein